MHVNFSLHKVDLVCVFTMSVQRLWWSEPFLTYLWKTLHGDDEWCHKDPSSTIIDKYVYL